MSDISEPLIEFEIKSERDLEKDHLDLQLEHTRALTKIDMYEKLVDLELNEKYQLRSQNDKMRSEVAKLSSNQSHKQMPISKDDVDLLIKDIVAVKNAWFSNTTRITEELTVMETLKCVEIIRNSR